MNSITPMCPSVMMFVRPPNATVGAEREERGRERMRVREWSWRF
jgi:hypothetical protein